MALLWGGQPPAGLVPATVPAVVPAVVSPARAKAALVAAPRTPNASDAGSPIRAARPELVRTPEGPSSEISAEETPRRGSVRDLMKRYEMTP